MKSEINVAKDFSRHPAGRDRKDGPYSGQLFREKFLEPALRNKNHLLIDLDGTRGYGSSFLEEAFGGLIRKGFAFDSVKQFIQVQSTSQSLVDEIWEYVDDAVRVSEGIGK